MSALESVGSTTRRVRFPEAVAGSSKSSSLESSSESDAERVFASAASPAGSVGVSARCQQHQALVARADGHAHQYQQLRIHLWKGTLDTKRACARRFRRTQYSSRVFSLRTGDSSVLVRAHHKQQGSQPTTISLTTCLNLHLQFVLEGQKPHGFED